MKYLTAGIASVFTVYYFNEAIDEIYSYRIHPFNSPNEFFIVVSFSLAVILIYLTLIELSNEK